MLSLSRLSPGSARQDQLQSVAAAAHQRGEPRPVSLSQTEQQRRREVMVSTVQIRVYSQQGLAIPWFAQSPRTVSRRPEEVELPSDPRTWSRAEVTRWVESVCSRHSLPLPSQDRFMMNGKAVCLMTAAMFCNRVPLGGKTLYRDFQIRLAKALNN